MSLAHQTIRNVLQRNQCGSFYSISKQNLGFRRLHHLTLRPGPERKLNVSALARLDNVKSLGCFKSFGRNTASVFIISRNESSNANPNFSSAVSHSRPEQVTAHHNASTGPVGEGVKTSTSASGSTSNPASSQNVTPAGSSSQVEATTASQDTLVFESIPEPPTIPVEEIVGAVVGEPSLSSLGLGGWSPSGIVQQTLEFFHVGLGMPWWASIVTGTIIVRVLLFPLVVKSQKNAAKMQNHMPELQVLQTKMTEARMTGNAILSAKYGQEMMLFMKEKEISPLKSMVVPLAMAPVFISCFFGIRKMANLPVESMKDGGLFWFTDLTLADPFYILPLITSVTVWITLEVGADGMKLNAQQHGQLLKYVFRALPVIMFPFTLNFPAAILCYWVSTNAISLIQVSLLKVPAVRAKLNIEPLRKITPEMMPVKKKGFKDSFKESWTNMKITREIEDRQRYDEISFKRAGRGPIPKTFKYDPTKGDPMSEPTAIQAKRK